ncbi:hypothetical protein HFP15_17250 [Amycolatopsis sp. K13G38]|uniref:Uncharacterized protein n=1 Tax=Amycolatopsis acididurans TaxID=2724524 RepID=A0ABX1J8D0_9PSEU|nr:hypothetical protein [Amycolatopsis acididurans]NKQ54631.1 hypothetical protein [Amycolatopsis acididurans]
MDLVGTGSEVIPALYKGLLDDAAVFPPGLMPLADAVPAHARHLAAPYADIVGPLVLAAPALADLGDVDVELSVTLPGGPAQLPEVLERAGKRLRGLEIAVPGEMSPREFFAALVPADVPVFVEVPRDERRPEVIALCAEHGHQAKFRTGGVKAELYPDEAELAAAVRAVVDAGVPFKATAGLHHAIRNTDPATGFEQHGYLNLMLATAAALDGADEARLAGILSERDGAAIARDMSTMDSPVRARFRSFGTCSITEPLTELVALGLLPGLEGVTA